MAESSGDSDAEDIDFDELQSSHSDDSSALDVSEQKVSLADLVSHSNIQEQIQGKMDVKARLENLPDEVKRLPESSVIKNALIQLLVYNSDTLYGVYTPVASVSTS